MLPPASRVNWPVFWPVLPLKFQVVPASRLMLPVACRMMLEKFLLANAVLTFRFRVAGSAAGGNCAVGGNGAVAGGAQVDGGGIEQECARLRAGLRAGIHRGVEGFNIGGADLDIAAVAAIDAAGDVDLAAVGITENVPGFEGDGAAFAAVGGGIATGGNLRAGFQIERIGRDEFDDPVVILDRVCLDEAALIDHLGVEGDGAAIGDDIAVIVHGTLGQDDLHGHAATIGPLAQSNRLAGGETDIATGRLDIAVVLDLVGNEEAIAAIADLDLAVVDDAGQGVAR